MKNSFGVEVLQAVENLGGEGLGDLLTELAMLPDTAADGATRNVFQESANFD